MQDVVARTECNVIGGSATIRGAESRSGRLQIATATTRRHSRPIFDTAKHATLDGVAASPTDAKRMLEAYIAIELGGGVNEFVRKHAKAALDLAVQLQHRRTATFRDAAICVEATTSVVNLIAIIAGLRDRSQA